MDPIIIFSKIAGPIVSLLSFFLAAYVFVWNRDAIFRNTLHNRQIEELLSVRRKLHDVWFQVHSSKFWADNIKSLNRSVKDFQNEQAEDWAKHKKFQDDAIYVLYAFSHKNYCLFPRWIDSNAFEDLLASFKKLAPFTFLPLQKASSDEILQFQDILLRKIEYLDNEIRKNLK